MPIKSNNKSGAALILCAIILVQQLFSPVMARSIHLDETGEAEDLLTEDKAAFTPEPKTAVPGAIIDELTKKILHKELELERLNIVFRKKTTLESPWRQRRLFAYGEGTACMGETSLLLATPALCQLANAKKKDAPLGASQRRDLVASTKMSLIAHSFAAGGDLVELGLNFKNYRSLKKEGFTPSIYKEEVHSLRAEIDRLLAQRRQDLKAVNDFSETDKIMAEAEGKLLHRLRDLYLLEYIDYHTGCKGLRFGQNVAFLTDFVKNATGAAGAIIGLQALHLHRFTWFGGAGLMILLSGAIVLGTPLVGRVTGNISGVEARKIVAEEAIDIHTCTVKAYCSDYHSFLAMNERNHEDTIYANELRKRIPLYEDQEKIMLMRKRFLKQEEIEAHKSLIENAIFAGIIGPAKMTNGITTMIAGSHYSHNTPTGGKLYAAGYITFIPAVAYGIVETAKLAIVFEKSRWKLKNSDLLPSNQFNRRLRLLDNMDRILSKSL